MLACLLREKSVRAGNSQRAQRGSSQQQRTNRQKKKSLRVAGAGSTYPRGEKETN